MQLPTIIRSPEAHPAGIGGVAAAANRVIPVAPVNPAINLQPTAQGSPSVIDMVNPALKVSASAAVQAASAPESARSKPEEVTAPRDWTIHRPPVEKVEDPPPKPMAQVLMDHLKSVWTASASAIQMEQVKNQLTPLSALNPSEARGDLARENLTYQPSKINKNEGI